MPPSLQGPAPYAAGRKRHAEGHEWGAEGRAVENRKRSCETNPLCRVRSAEAPVKRHAWGRAALTGAIRRRDRLQGAICAAERLARQRAVRLRRRESTRTLQHAASRALGTHCGPRHADQTFSQEGMPIK